MKILFAGDEHPYSAYALNEVVRLATNTWADVTLLAVSPAEAAAKPGRGPAPGPGPTRVPGDFSRPAPAARAHPMPWGPGGMSGFP